MRALLITFVVYVAAVMETSLTEAVSIGHVGPDLLAMVAMIWLLVATGPRALLIAGAIGMLSDLTAGGRVGLGLGCFLLVGYGSGRLRARLALDRVPAQVLAVWVGVTLLAVGQAIGRWMLGEVPLRPSLLLWRAAGVGLYTAGVSLPVLMVIGWIREPHLARERKLGGL